MTSGSVAATSSWFVRPPSDDAPARIFCFPYSGTGASAFSAWPAVMGDVEICPLQFPGRENRLADAHYGTYEELADALVDALAPHLDRPFALFGHCAGALPAFETVVRLDARGRRRPDCLVVSGQAAPHDDLRDRMLGMSDTELRTELASVVRGRGIEPRADMIEVGLSVLTADLAAARVYRRADPVTVRCPIVALHWRDDPDVSREQVEEWRRYADSVDVRVIAGGHYEFMNAPAELQQSVTSWR